MADENKTERVQLLMTPSELKAIDDWSFENRIRGRAEAIRRLCQMGIGLETESQQIVQTASKIPSLYTAVLNALIDQIAQWDDSKAEEIPMMIDKLTNTLAEHGDALQKLFKISSLIKSPHIERIAGYSIYQKAIELSKLTLDKPPKE